MKKDFLKGLWTLVPYLITFFLIKWIMGALVPILAPIESFGPLPKWAVKCIVVFFIIVFIWLIGVLSKYRRVNRFMSLVWSPVASRIPFLNHLIKVKDQVDEKFTKSSSFKRVVVVKFMGVLTIGFVTNENPKFFRKLLKNPNLIFVTVSAAPPTSSFPLLYDNREVIDTGLSVPSGIKVVSTFGAAEPETEQEENMEEPHLDSEWGSFYLI